MDSVRETFIWQGLTTEVLHVPNWSPELVGGLPRHLRPCALPSGNKRDGRAPLPISAAGYRSHFERADNIEAMGGAVAYVQTWLAHDAQSPAWIEAHQQARQMSLF